MTIYVSEKDTILLLLYLFVTTGYRLPASRYNRLNPLSNTVCGLQLYPILEMP